MKKKLLVLSAAAILFLVPNQAKADVVYSNFGPGNSYQEDIGWTVGEQTTGSTPYTGDFMEPAAAFTPTADYNLTSVQAAISLYSGTDNSVELLLTNSINNQPGTTLESFLFTNQMGPLGANNTPLIADSVTTPELIAGDQYWLVAVDPDPTNTIAAWNFSNTDGLALDSADNGNTWFNLDTYYPNQGAFLINGTPVTSAVPEPPTLLLFAFAGALVLLFNSRKILKAA